MKTSVINFRKAVTVSLSLLLFSSLAFADGLFSDVYVSGSTGTPAGSYVVQSTDLNYFYQGDIYSVYNVYYDNPDFNMKIAVKDGKNSNSFLAYTNNYWFKYNCSREGFGVRKAMFNNPVAMVGFNPEQYYEQEIIKANRKVETKEAVELIASYLPRMRN